jgi:hypothetical protein
MYSISSSFDWIKVIGGTLLMDTNLGDALSGLLLLGSDSNNNSDDGSTTCITNDSNFTPTSSINGGSTPTSNAGSMDTAPTPPAAEMKKRKYKKRGSTSFWKRKGTTVSGQFDGLGIARWLNLDRLGMVQWLDLNGLGLDVLVTDRRSNLMGSGLPNGDRTKGLLGSGWLGKVWGGTTGPLKMT